MGKVYLVGAGPGDAKLITLRGFELIQRADVIIYDFLVNKELLTSTKSDAEIIYVGKQASKHELPQHDINSLIIQKAKEKDTIVRLKGGAPLFSAVEEKKRRSLQRIMLLLKLFLALHPLLQCLPMQAFH
jgi:siroheme synthase